jgi:hypothetical protein
MSNPHDAPATPHIEVEDPDAALRKTEDFARRVLAVPKKKIDAMMAKEKITRKRRRR